MVDNKAPPMSFWVVAIALFGGCCGVTGLLYAVAPNVAEWGRRETFMRGVRESMDLPAADEARLAAIAYDAMMASGPMRTYDEGGPNHTAADGARRADDRTLMRLHELRTTLARASPSLCASMWTGATDPNEVYPLLARQPDEVVFAFFTATFGLLDAAYAGGPVVVTPEEIETEVNAIFAAASISRSPSAIATAVELGDAADPTQQCAAILELYDFINAQPEPARSRSARVLFCALSPVE